VKKFVDLISNPQVIFKIHPIICKSLLTYTIMASLTVTPSENGVVVVIKDESNQQRMLTFNSRLQFYRFLDAQVQWQKRERRSKRPVPVADQAEP
jgi:hypothetical protein